MVGINNNTDFLRSVHEGQVSATATPIWQGERQQLWQVAMTDEALRQVALGQLRLQNLS